MEEKIRFRDLSTSLKIAVVSAWFVGMIWVLSFCIGVIMGIVEVWYL